MQGMVASITLQMIDDKGGLLTTRSTPSNRCRMPAACFPVPQPIFRHPLQKPNPDVFVVASRRKKYPNLAYIAPSEIASYMYLGVSLSYASQTADFNALALSSTVRHLLSLP